MDFSYEDLEQASNYDQYAALFGDFRGANILDGQAALDYAASTTQPQKQQSEASSDPLNESGNQAASRAAETQSQDENALFIPDNSADILPPIHTGLSDLVPTRIDALLDGSIQQPEQSDAALAFHQFRSESIWDASTSNANALVGFPRTADLLSGFGLETVSQYGAIGSTASHFGSADLLALPYESIESVVPQYGPVPALPPPRPPFADPAFGFSDTLTQQSAAPRAVQDFNGNWVLVFDNQQPRAPTKGPHPRPLPLRQDPSYSAPSPDQQTLQRQPTQSPAPAQTHQISHLRAQTSNYSPDQPQRDNERPWVRTNGRNKPDGSTRTGKITQYKPQAAYSIPNAPIHDPWVGRNTNKIFDYNSYGELKELKYTAAELEDYMLNFNPSAKTRLKIWIQKAPADSARRQPTSGSSKCRMAECPAAIYDSTITVGSFRLAFDEQWHAHGMRKDPHVCAGFVHLYCAERFLNFRQLVRGADVEPDERLFNTEPNGRFAASLAQSGSGADAHAFLRAARAPNPLDFDIRWLGYPAAPVPPGQAFEEAHLRTLNCTMFRTKNASMNESKIKMLENRGIKRSNQLAHLGDVEKAVKSRHSRTVRRRRLVRENLESDAEEEVEEQQQQPVRKKLRVGDPLVSPRRGAVIEMKKSTEVLAPMCNPVVEAPVANGVDTVMADALPVAPTGTDAEEEQTQQHTAFATVRDRGSSPESDNSRTLRKRKHGVSYAEDAAGAAATSDDESLFGG